MGQISVEIYEPAGSVLSGNQHLGRAGLELPITVAIISDAHPQTGQLQMQAVLRKNALAPSP